MPKNILVLIFAKISSAVESFREKICVVIAVASTNIANISIENILVAEVIIKNQNEKPAVTASALNLGEDTSILYRIN